MEQDTTPNTKYHTPLRQAQRNLTRSRIKNAARNLFYEKRYEATTMDEIATDAGLRRSTLYLHYKDKAEILADIVADYVPKAQGVLAALPGPAPTLDQLQRWIRKVAAFVVKERVSLSIILEMRHNDAHSGALEHLTRELISALGKNNPRYQDAAASDGDQIEWATGLLLFQELTFTCEQFLFRANDEKLKALVKVTAQHFHDFLK